jgi:transposase
VEKITRIGIDTSKSVFQLHGVDENDQPVLRKKPQRRQVLKFLEQLAPAKIGIEACGAAHHWGQKAVHMIASDPIKPLASALGGRGPSTYANWLVVAARPVRWTPS